MEFHDDYPQYEIMAHHSEEDGKKLRRKLWNVFWIMLVITIVELIIGFMAPGKGWSGTFGLKALFISLTIAKAGFIVMSFMHLGHEVKFFKYVILSPYAIFMCYCIFICLNEGTYSSKPENKTRVDKLLIEQQQMLRAGHGHGGDHGAAGHENSGEHGGEHH
jgi:cytochrome c oxidase subunit IV